MIKAIPNFKGYFADTEGNIYSDKTKGGYLRKLKLSPRNKKDGHLRVMFSGDRKCYSVHRVVYETFNGSIPKGMLVCHKNDIPSDNRIENLYVGTPQDNINDSIRNGTKARGSKIGGSKLTDELVKEILSLKDKTRITDIANMFNVSKSTICDIFKNRTWKHIER